MKYIIILKIINGLGHQDFLEWQYKTLRECRLGEKFVEAATSVKVKCRRI